MEIDTRMDQRLTLDRGDEERATEALGYQVHHESVAVARDENTLYAHLITGQARRLAKVQVEGWAWKEDLATRDVVRVCQEKALRERLGNIKYHLARVHELTKDLNVDVFCLFWSRSLRPPEFLHGAAQHVWQHLVNEPQPG